MEGGGERMAQKLTRASGKTTTRCITASRCRLTHHASAFAFSISCTKTKKGGKKKSNKKKPVATLLPIAASTSAPVL